MGEGQQAWGSTGRPPSSWPHTGLFLMALVLCDTWVCDAATVRLLQRHSRSLGVGRPPCWMCPQEGTHCFGRWDGSPCFPMLAPHFTWKRKGITNRMVAACSRPRVPSPPVPSSRGCGRCSALLCWKSPTPAEQVIDAQWALLCSPPRQAWDLAVDICLSQLPTIIEEGTAFRVSPPGSCVVRRALAGTVPGARVSATPST